jgi:hypothetical protein
MVQLDSGNLFLALLFLLLHPFRLSFFFKIPILPILAFVDSSILALHKDDEGAG